MIFISGDSCIFARYIGLVFYTVKTQPEKPALPGQRGSMIRVMLHLLSKRLDCHRITMNKIDNQGRRFIYWMISKKVRKKTLHKHVQLIRETLVGVVFFILPILKLHKYKIFHLFFYDGSHPLLRKGFSTVPIFFYMCSRLRIWRVRFTHYMQIEF